MAERRRMTDNAREFSVEQTSAIDFIGEADHITTALHGESCGSNHCKEKNGYG
jgi:hypothetical protein